MNDKDDLDAHFLSPSGARSHARTSRGVALCGLATTPAAATAARNSPTPRYFTASEAATIDALVAQIIPTDDMPGAREMGVVGFIDQALAGFLSPLAPGFESASRTSKRIASLDTMAGKDSRRSRPMCRLSGFAKSSTPRFSSPCSN
jgi:hypothetical protein